MQHQRIENPYEIIFQRLDRIDDLLLRLEGLVKDGKLGKHTVDRSVLATRQNAAEYIGVSVGTIDNLVKSKQLKATKIGSSTRFRWQDLDAFVEKRAR